MYKEDLALNNLQWLIIKLNQTKLTIKLNQTKSYIFNIYKYRGFGNK